MMPSICGTMIGELGLPSLVDHHGCVLSMGARGQAWQWEEDLECTCEHCRQCEGDYCVVYWRVGSTVGAG